MPPRRLLLLVALSTTLGCAATSGQEWLSSPLDASESSSAARIDDPPPILESPEARPRLRHTVTLGESYAVATADGYGPPAAGNAGTQVNVHVPVTVNNYNGYGGYAYGGLGYVYANDPGPSRPSTGHPSQPPLQPGQNFAPPPSYGPSFPFHSAPASPWAR